MSDTEDAMIEIPNKKILVTLVNGETGERKTINTSKNLREFTSQLGLTCQFCKGDKDYRK